MLARKLLRYSLFHAQPGQPVDLRRRRMVAVIECTLNQNVRDAGAANFPAMNGALIDLCREYDVGIFQIPCPEVACLGFDRARPPGTSVRQALDTALGRQCCAGIGAQVANRLVTYAGNGCQVLAVLGGNPQSPGCAVHNGSDGLLPESGVLMWQLQTELRQQGLEIPFHGMRDANAEQLTHDMDWLRAVFAEAGRAIQKRKYRVR